MTEIRISDLSELAARPADDDLFVIVDVSEPLDGDKTKKVTFANLSSPVKIIAVKSAEFTGTQAASLAEGGNVAITDLSITHTLAKSTNKLLLLGQAGLVANSRQISNTGIAFADDGTLFSIGDASGVRVRVGASGRQGYDDGINAQSRFIQSVYEPGDILSHTYTLRALNVQTTTSTVYINFMENDGETNNTARARAVSSLLVIELEG